ncbi:MAG: hypothetical protein QOC78_268 [Solirubrobacteraceae bacterium]|jgi:DNA invertase Pin-like site-specific DNA recombinase|nr:hypothetical protein [Solirubrobacteraceae bacterium]
MADLLTRVHGEIRARMQELRPFVQEEAKLRAALQAIGASAPGEGNGGRKPSNRRTPARSRTRAARGAIRQRVIDYVTTNPGSTASDVARALGLNRNSVATRLAQLSKDGKLKKATRGYKA